MRPILLIVVVPPLAWSEAEPLDETPKVIVVAILALREGEPVDTTVIGIVLHGAVAQPEAEQIEEGVQLVCSAQAECGYRRCIIDITQRDHATRRHLQAIRCACDHAVVRVPMWTCAARAAVALVARRQLLRWHQVLSNGRERPLMRCSLPKQGWTYMR